MRCVCVLGSQDAANLAYLDLYAFQHRGQESAGIASMTEDNRSVSEEEMGTWRMCSRRRGWLGCRGHGHRTCKVLDRRGSMLFNAQPIVPFTSKGPIAVAHRGSSIALSVIRT